MRRTLGEEGKVDGAKENQQLRLKLVHSLDEASRMLNQTWRFKSASTSSPLRKQRAMSGKDDNGEKTMGGTVSNKKEEERSARSCRVLEECPRSHRIHHSNPAQGLARPSDPAP